MMPQGTAFYRARYDQGVLTISTSDFLQALVGRNINAACEIRSKVILENRLDRKVVLWFYPGVVFPNSKGAAMAYDWDGKRTRRLQMLRFMGALAIPALLFGSAITALQWTDTDGSAERTVHHR